MKGIALAVNALLASFVAAVPADGLNKRAGYACRKDALGSTLVNSKYSSAASAFCSSYIRPQVTVKKTKTVSVTSSVLVTPMAATSTVSATVTKTQTSTAGASLTNTVVITKTNLISSTVVNSATVTSTGTSTSTVLETVTETKYLATVTSVYGNPVGNDKYHKRAYVTPSTNSAGYPTFIAATYKASVVKSSCSCLITPQALKPTTLSTTVLSTATIKKTSTVKPLTVIKTVTSTSTKVLAGPTVTKTFTAQSTVLVSSTSTRTVQATITQQATTTLVQTKTATSTLSTTSVVSNPKDIYCNVEGVTNGANLITDGWDIATSASDCMSLCRGAGNCAMMHFGCPNSDGCYCGLYSSNDLGESYYMGSSGWGNKYLLWDALCEVNDGGNGDEEED